MSPQQESRQEEIAPDKLELDLNAGTIVALAVAVSVVGRRPDFYHIRCLHVRVAASPTWQHWQ